jgi:hypothetical protein
MFYNKKRITYKQDIMKTLKYYLTPLTQFFKSLNSKTKTVDSDNIEFTYPKFGINFKPASGKTSNSLFDQMYAEENETLFI